MPEMLSFYDVPHGVTELSEFDALGFYGDIPLFSCSSCGAVMGGFTQPNFCASCGMVDISAHHSKKRNMLFTDFEFALCDDEDGTWWSCEECHEINIVDDKPKWCIYCGAKGRSVCDSDDS